MYESLIVYILIENESKIHFRKYVVYYYCATFFFFVFLSRAIFICMENWSLPLKGYNFWLILVTQDNNVLKVLQDATLWHGLFVFKVISETFDTHIFCWIFGNETVIICLTTKFFLEIEYRSPACQTNILPTHQPRRTHSPVSK